MAFSYVSASSGTNGGNSSTASTGTITAPSSGDLVVVYINSNSTTAISHGGSEGTAFTEAVDEDQTPQTPSQSARQALYWKIAGASEPTAYTFTVGSAQWRVCVKTFSSASDAEVDSAAVTGYGSSGTDMVCFASNGRTVSADAVSIVAGGKDNRGAAEAYTTADNSYVSAIGDVGDNMAAMAHRIWSSGGGTDSTITIQTADANDGRGDDCYSVHISFVESGGGGGGGTFKGLTLLGAGN